MKAYAVTIGFDKSTTDIIQEHIDKIAKATKNDYMVSNNIEPHITIGAFCAENGQAIIDILDIETLRLKPDMVFLKSIESFYPNVVYISPEKNSYLSILNQTIHNKMSDLFVAADHEYYTPKNCPTARLRFSSICINTRSLSVKPQKSNCPFGRPLNKSALQNVCLIGK